MDVNWRYGVLSAKGYVEKGLDQEGKASRYSLDILGNSDALNLGMGLFCFEWTLHCPRRRVGYSRVPG